MPFCRRASARRLPLRQERWPRWKIGGFDQGSTRHAMRSLVDIGVGILPRGRICLSGTTFY